MTQRAPAYFPGAAMLLGGAMTLASCWLCYRTLKAHPMPVRSTG